MPKKQTKKVPTSVVSHVRRHAKLALVPHKGNQFRPHLLRRYGLVAVVAFVFLLQAGYNSMTSGNVLGTQAVVTSRGLLDATNQERQRQGQKPLVFNSDLTKAAQLKVQNMFADQYWAHNAPDGTTPWHWFGVVGYSYATAGENLAKNFTTPESIISAWMASPTHRANVLKSDYKDVGFATMDGMLDGHHTTLVVALYAAPEDSASVQGANVSTKTPVIDSVLSPMTRFGIGLQSLTPAATASIVVLLVGVILAFVAHLYRSKLPQTLRRTWYRHHGIYKAIGFASLAVIVVFAYGGVGQI